MPTIEITDDQRDYLEDLRAELADEHVGEYGAVRAQDALQFLIDRYESDGAPDTDAPEGPTGTGGDGDGEPGGDARDEGEGGDATPGGDTDRLQAMMNLLDQHDDKWAESGSEEGKYVVSLPDGSEEHVRTRDDVRALLFKHYR